MDNALCRMIESRRRIVDKRLKADKVASLWPLGQQVCVNTAALIFDIVEFCEVLKDDGFTEQDAIRRIATFSNQPLPDADGIDLGSYLKLCLQATDRAFVAMGPTILNQSIAIASRCVRDEIASRNSSRSLFPTFPPIEWLQVQISHQKVKECDISTREWIRLQLRMKPDDEVWYFSGFLGQNLGTSAGVAL